MRGKNFRITLVFTAFALLVLSSLRPTASPRFSSWSPPVNIGPPINSAFVDSGAALSKNGLSLYFHSNRPGGLGGNDIWVSQRASVNDPWGPPENLGPNVNTSLEERAPDLSRDGHTLFFVSNRPGGVGGDDIWFSWRAHTRNDLGWLEAQNVGTGVNTTAGEAGPSYFENDDEGIPLLYFHSNRPGGSGDFDIYVSALTAEGSFGPAVFVPELSSPQGDAAPSIRFDGLEIFLFSNRLGSIGGSQDLWVSTRESTLDPWSSPVNLGTTINTGFNEVLPRISPDRETLFFGSNRPGGLGLVDIYQSTRIKLRGPEGD